MRKIDRTITQASSKYLAGSAFVGSVPIKSGQTSVFTHYENITVQTAFVG